MPDILAILKENREKRFRKRMEKDPVLAEAKMVAEIVLEELKPRLVDELVAKARELIKDGEPGEPGESIQGEPGEPGQDGYTPQKGVDYFDGKDGQDYTLTEKDKKEIAAKIKVPIVEKVIEKTEIIKEPIIKEVAVADNALQIAEKLNTLTEKVEMKVIKGLEKTIDNLRNSIREAKGKVKLGGGGDIINYYDLTSYCDGLTKVFTIPENRSVIGLFSTQFPVNYRPLIDWTISGRTLTLTSEVGAPQTGQTLWVLYIR